MNRGVALLNSAQIEVDFKNLSEPDDSLHIIFSRPDNGLLQLGAINGLQITLFNGTTQIGAPITNTDPVLNLALLNLIGSPDPLAAITMVPPAQFDRVVISYGGVANVLDAIRIHDVDIKPVIETVIAPNVNGEVELCSTDLLSLQLHDNCTTYQVYDSSDNPLATTNHLDFELPPGLTEGNYTFYVQAIRQGCEFGAREEITVHINPNATTTDFGDILVNGTIPSGDLCLVTNPNVTLNAQLSASSTITNPVYSWYDENDTPITGGSNGILDLGTLAVGTYTYGVRVSGDAICENVTPVEITFTITDEATPTAAETAQEFCAVNNPTAADLQVNESPIVWYDAPTGGNIVDPSTVLTDGASYYAAHQGANCESSARLQIDVTILDEPTPTANTTSQEFCAANNPTAADMQINETPIVWYDAPTGGNIVDPSTVLTDGASYYAAHQGANCESSARLQIDITILDEPTPTANTTSQEFCAANNPTAADMQINESPIVWYDAPTGGNIVDPSTVLTDGASYYAAHQGANCESSARLQIDITILDEPIPTANTTSQEFCAANNPTAADMQINESSIVWYDAPTGGNIVDPSTALTDGASYYAAHQGANCESSTRLQIDVTILDDGIASLNGETQAVCYSNSYTYTTDANMSDYQWNVTGGTIISGGGINDDFAEVNWDSYPDGTISVSYPNSAVCNGFAAESYDIDIASCSDLTITKTADKENVAAGETVVFTITVENNGTSTLNDLDISENLPSGYTYVSHTTSTGTYVLATGNWNIPELASDSSATLMITVTVNSTGDYLNTATVVTSTPLDTDPGNNDASAEVNVICLTVYNEFSPNNDGENDYLIIDCIENYPNNKIEIFNRYGNVVYETASYNNNWNGMANVGGVVSKGEYLPNGTYFYVLKIDELNFSKTGWIYLAR
ncbi:hypothetical protein DI487_14120 [Flavobacterium sediminis]|uniref:DUF11 domain-containing protein n=1 Tax=Flavobacterium sediminis TaxID=2201181 RepID=A0A2U8QXP3_9FLAO|nr:gliding motility-associated C-terminal domain-containing protein [Flavobacterium sediminis]AWM14878.1 hypothetical protein DI487_14120 [Flavobacterium sediminis]